jgi:hypothetical protein
MGGVSDIAARMRLIDAELAAERARVAAEKESIVKKSGAAEWNRVRSAKTKRIYNLLERRNGLALKAAAPDTLVLYDAKVSHIRVRRDFRGRHLVPVESVRVFDNLQIVGDRAQPIELKSSIAVPDPSRPAGAITRSVEGGLSRGDILVNFRDKTAIADQIRKEAEIRRLAKLVDGVIVVEGRDVMTGQRVVREFAPDNLATSRIVPYNQLPDVVMEGPSSTGARAAGVTSISQGSRGIEPSSQATGARTSGGTSTVEPRSTSPTGGRTGPAERVSAAAGHLARGAAIRTGRIALGAVKLVRATTVFAARLLIPPFTPASLFASLLLDAMFLLLDSLEQKRRERMIQEAVASVPEQVARYLQAQAHAERAAGMLLDSFESGGYGFVYAHPRIRLTNRRRVLGGWDTVVAEQESWHAELESIAFAKYRRSFDPPKPRKGTPPGDTVYVLQFAIDEPLLTPFEYLLWEIEVVRELLQAGWRAAHGGVPHSGFDAHIFDGVMRLVDLIRDELSRHRAIEEQHPGAYGIRDAATERKGLLSRAHANTEELLKHAAVVFRPGGDPASENIAQYFREGYGVAMQLRHDLERAIKIPNKALRYRIDPALDFFEAVEEARRQAGRPRRQVLILSAKN